MAGRIGFVCPDGEQITYEECFKACRMGSRCAPLPYLMGMAIRRKVTGHTVTELSEPTRLMMLRKTEDYFESPEKMDYAFRGSSHHFVLNRNASNEVLNEERLRLDLGEGRIISGAFDYYDPETKELADYKMWGAYKVRKTLDDLVANGGELRFDRNRDGEIVYSDSLGIVFQLNCYRLMLEHAGFPVEHLIAWLYVRDYNWMAKKQQHLDRKWYQVPIRIEPDTELLRYARKRYDALEAALQERWAEKCSVEETWGRKRCRDWCPLRAPCDRMPVMPQMEV